MNGRLSTFFRRRYVSERHEHGRARYLSAKTDPEGSKELQSGATEKALVVCPTLPPRSLNNTGHSTAILPESGSSFERNLSTALMERIPSRWLRPEWHVPCKSYRVVIQGHFGWVRAVAFDPSNEWFWFCTGSAVGLFIERKNQGIGNLLGMVKAGMADEALLGYENMEERIRRLKELSLSFDEKIIDSVVKVFSATTRHDPYRPWQNLEMRQSDGSGFAISGKRILTCAHVVGVLNQCTFIHVQRNNSTTLYKARVTKITHECDLAILEVDNDDFWEGMSALSFADIPPLGEALTVVGFPEGHESHVCETGLVLGIKFQRYSHSQTEHLVIVVDANIISGHSGGPVITQGKVIGVAFQSTDFYVFQAHIGSVIPTCVVMQFLSSSEESQQLSSLSSLGLIFKDMSHNGPGVEIKRISSLSGAHKIMCPFDIMLEIDNIAIGNDGRVPFRREEHIDFRYLVSLKKPGESLLIKFQRSAEVHEREVTLKPVTPHIEVQQYYDRPKYYIFGGLVFVPFSKAYMENIGDELSKCVLLCATETKAKDLEAGGELVMLSRILRHDTNHSCDHLENLQVYKVNGVKVNSLKHLVELIEQCCMEYLTLDLQGGYVAELHYSSAKEAASEIMELYRIFYSKSKNLSD